MDISLLLNPPSQLHGGSSDQPHLKQDAADECRQRKRTRATPDQVEVLKRVFEETRGFPSTTQRRQLAQQLGFTPRGVQIWFQNRRQDCKKWRRSLDFQRPVLPPPLAIANSNVGRSIDSPLSPFLPSSVVPETNSPWSAAPSEDQTSADSDQPSRKYHYNYAS